MSEKKEGVTLRDSASHCTMGLSVFLSLAQVSFLWPPNSSMPDERPCYPAYFVCITIFLYVYCPYL